MNKMKVPVSLYHAFCEFACALICTDHPLVAGDKQKLHSILMDKQTDFNDLIQHVLARECMDIGISYLWVRHELKYHADDLTTENKRNLLRIIEKVNSSFQPMSSAGTKAVSHFIEELKL